MNRTPLTLFLTFAKIGLFTFGGGYAMLPLIQREAVENHRWVEDGDILDIVAIAESTPGPIAINAATFIGQKVAGVPGALCATLGVVLPSFAIIAALSYALEALQALRPVRYAFWGVRAGVLALVLRAMVNLFRQCGHDGFSLVLMALSLAAVALFRVDAILVIGGCACLGVLWRQAGRARR